MYFEYRIVKIEKGLFLIEYKTAPYGVWHEVKRKIDLFSKEAKRLGIKQQLKLQ